jgi:hypothetical protein
MIHSDWQENLVRVVALAAFVFLVAIVLAVAF